MATDQVPVPPPVHLLASLLMFSAMDATVPAWAQAGASYAGAGAIVTPPAGHGYE